MVTVRELQILFGISCASGVVVFSNRTMVIIGISDGDCRISITLQGKNHGKLGCFIFNAFSFFDISIKYDAINDENLDIDAFGQLGC